MEAGFCATVIVESRCKFPPETVTTVEDAAGPMFGES